jgi:hypothetical protein
MGAHLSKNAVAFQVIAALESYEANLKKLAATWLDMDLYSQVSHHLDVVRLHAAGLPSIAVAWVEVLISHTELIHDLWRSTHAQPKAAASNAQLLDRHLAAIASLRGKCVRELHLEPRRPAH